LHPEVAEAVRRNGFADRIGGKRVRTPQLDYNATAEINPKIEAGIKEEHHRNDAQDRRDDDTSETAAHEFDVGAVDAPTYALSFAAGALVSTNSADTMAGVLAVRVPDPEALEIICRGAARILAVSEAEIRRAMRILFTDTHNAAEGAGAAALAAALQERHRLAGKRVAVIQSGGTSTVPSSPQCSRRKTPSPLAEIAASLGATPCR
jgi:hypothetical protein